MGVPGVADRDLSGALRGANSADPAAGCEGVCAAAAVLADASIEDFGGAEAGGAYGTGDAPVLSKSDRAGDGRGYPETAGRSGGDRAQEPGRGGGEGGEHNFDGEEEGGGSAGASGVCADWAAGPAGGNRRS